MFCYGKIYWLILNYNDVFYILDDRFIHFLYLQKKPLEIHLPVKAAHNFFKPTYRTRCLYINSAASGGLLNLYN